MEGPHWSPRVYESRALVPDKRVIGKWRCLKSERVKFPIYDNTSNERRPLDVSSILKWAGTKEQRVFQPSTRTAGLFTTIPIYCDFLRSGCVPGEDKVASFGLIVAGKAGTHKRLVARFAVFEVSEPPTARHGVLFRVLDHKLNVRGGAGNERLGAAKDLVVFV